MKNRIQEKRGKGVIADDGEEIDDIVNNVFVGKLTVDKIFGLWNRFADEYDVTRCSFLSDSLRRKITKNIKDIPPGSWKECFCQIQKSIWLHDKGWFNLSWLMKQENFTKVMDGAYSKSMKQDMPSNAVGTKTSVERMMKKWKKKTR